MRNRRPHAAGMTLIEVLVALALLSMLSTGLIGAFRYGHSSYRQLIHLNRSQWDVLAAQRFVRSAVESAYPFGLPGSPDSTAQGLEGNPERLALTTPMTSAAGAAGNRRYEIYARRRSDGLQDLVVSAQLDRNGPSENLQDDKRTADTLIERVAKFEWSYQDAGELPQWHSSWREHKPPGLVRLRMSFAPGDPRLWPDLLIAPRVTDDANCDFDIIAQACREGQP